MNIIPAIDIRNGRCVRLLYGEYDQETRYDVDPIALATKYAQLGLRNLHLVDLDGAKAGHPVNGRLLREMVKASGVRVQIGGGIRTDDHIRELLECGVTRIVVGSLTIKSPDTVMRWLNDFGADAIVAAFDVRVGDDGIAYICTDAWTKTTDQELIATIMRYREAGLRHVLCTDIGRDGAMSGPAIELYEDILKACPAIELQASGGVSKIGDLITLRNAGLSGAITGKALLEGRITDEELRSF